MSNQSGTVRLHRVLRAPSERVYKAFLDSAALERWLPPYGFTGRIHEMNPTVGGGYRMSFTNLQRDRSWHVWKLEQVAQRIKKLQEVAKKWLELRNFQLDNAPRWRESWHPFNVMVWGRDAPNRDDCLSIDWIHGNYAHESSIYRSTLTGQMGNAGRLWQRMYPVVKLGQNPENIAEPLVRKTSLYLESIVIFPDDHPKTKKFLNFLSQEQSDFQLLWGRDS